VGRADRSNADTSRQGGLTPVENPVFSEAGKAYRFYTYDFNQFSVEKSMRDRYDTYE